MKARITIELEDGRTIVREVENLHYTAEKVGDRNYLNSCFQPPSEYNKRYISPPERHMLTWEVYPKLVDETRRQDRK